MSENKEVPIILHSKKNMASMNVASIAIELIQGVLSILIFFFYETELGLSSILTGIGVSIYAVYDAFNDPVVGSHLTFIILVTEFGCSAIVENPEMTTS